LKDSKGGFAMKLIDPHMHVDTRTHEDMVEVAKKGVVAVISPAYVLLPAYDAQTILNATDHLIRMVEPTYDRFFIRVFVDLGLNMLMLPKNYQKVLERYPNYIEKHQEVVAIGEVGLDPRDPRKLGFVAETAVPTPMELQIEILKEEMRLGKKYNLPVDCHTPPNCDSPPIRRRDYVEKYLKLADEVGLPQNLLIIDHADEEMVRLISKTKAYAAITVQPWRNLWPVDAASIIGQFGTDRILVNCDAAAQPWPSNPFAVPDTAFAMKRYGLSDADVKKVTFENPMNLFKLNLEPQ
jgi:predicted metal-dependent TIM-barrel fold hydrolase